MVETIVFLTLMSNLEAVKNTRVEGNLHDVAKELTILRQSEKENNRKNSRIQMDEYQELQYVQLQLELIYFSKSESGGMFQVKSYRP